MRIQRLIDYLECKRCDVRSVIEIAGMMGIPNDGVLFLSTDGVQCRSRLDILIDDIRAILYKITRDEQWRNESASTSVELFSKSLQRLPTSFVAPPDLITKLKDLQTVVVDALCAAGAPDILERLLISIWSLALLKLTNKKAVLEEWITDGCFIDDCAHLLNSWVLRVRACKIDSLKLKITSCELLARLIIDATHGQCSMVVYEHIASMQLDRKSVV